MQASRFHQRIEEMPGLVSVILEQPRAVTFLQKIIRSLAATAASLISARESLNQDHLMVAGEFFMLLFTTSDHSRDYCLDPDDLACPGKVLPALAEIARQADLDLRLRPISVDE